MIKLNLNRILSLGSAFLAILYATHVAAQTPHEFTLTTGAEYSTGKYGFEESIDEIYVPVKLRYQTSQYALGLTVPYLDIRAPEGTVVDNDGAPIPGSGNTHKESGLGDIILSGTLYDVWTLPAQKMAMDLSAKVKFATGDEEQGLGTGENDYAVYADFYRWFDQTTLFVSAGYRFRGDPPGIDLKDSLLLSLGGAYRLSDINSFGVIYNFRESSVAGGDDPSELTAYLSHRLDARWRVRGYVFSGLNDASPDWGSGVLIELRL